MNQRTEDPLGERVSRGLCLFVFFNSHHMKLSILKWIPWIGTGIMLLQPPFASSSKVLSSPQRETLNTLHARSPSLLAPDPGSR